MTLNSEYWVHSAPNHSFLNIDWHRKNRLYATSLSKRSNWPRPWEGACHDVKISVQTLRSCCSDHHPPAKLQYSMHCSQATGSQPLLEPPSLAIEVQSCRFAAKLTLFRRCKRGELRVSYRKQGRRDTHILGCSWSIEGPSLHQLCIVTGVLPQAITTETLNYFDKASACVMVIDATDQKTVSHAQRDLAQLLDNENSALSACRVLLVLANKQVFLHWLAEGVTCSFAVRTCQAL